MKTHIIHVRATNAAECAAGKRAFVAYVEGEWTGRSGATREEAIRKLVKSRSSGFQYEVCPLDELPPPLPPGWSFVPNKPPLGVMPKLIWQQKRAAELARAIHERIDYGDLTTPLEDGWLFELDQLLLSIRNSQK